MRYSDFAARFDVRITDASMDEDCKRYDTWRAALNDIVGSPVWTATLLWLANNWHKLTDEQRDRLFATAALIFDTHGGNP